MLLQYSRRDADLTKKKLRLHQRLGTRLENPQKRLRAEIVLSAA